MMTDVRVRIARSATCNYCCSNSSSLDRGIDLEFPIGGPECSQERCTAGGGRGRNNDCKALSEAEAEAEAGANGINSRYRHEPAIPVDHWRDELRELRQAYFCQGR